MHHDSCPSMRERQPRRDVYTVDLKQSSVVFEFMYRGYTIHCQRAATSHAIISVVHDNLIISSNLDNVEDALQWCDNALEKAVHFHEIFINDNIHLPFERGRFAPSVKLEKIPISEHVFQALMKYTPRNTEDAKDNLIITEDWGDTCFIALYREGEVYYMVKIHDMEEY